MDSTTTPPPCSKSEPPHQSKSASRLARMISDVETDRIPHFTVDFSSPPSSQTRRKLNTPSSTPAGNKLSSSTTKPTISVPLHDLFLLSPTPSPIRHAKTRFLDSTDEAVNLSPVGSRRRCKVRGNSIGFPSPRSLRRSRRRLEVEVRDDREAGVVGDEVPKPRRKRQGSTRSKKENANSSSSVPHPSSSSSSYYGWEGINMDGVWQLMCDLVMWRDVAKSSLWFGFGCLCFLTLFRSLFSVASHLGLLFLGVSFISNTINQRNGREEKTWEFRLKEDDIMRITRVVLPTLNLAIGKTSRFFSGDPAMTLKVATFLLMGAKYGHLLTIWRFCALGFFTSFTVPKLYVSYAAQIDLRVEQWRQRVLEMWNSCSRKKAVAASVATAFWNLSSLKTRIFAAFFALVILRYCRQNTEEQETSLDGQNKKKNEQNNAFVEAEEASVVTEDEDSEKP